MLIDTFQISSQEAVDGWERVTLKSQSGSAEVIGAKQAIQPPVPSAPVPTPSLPPQVSYKELHECDPSKLLYLKNIKDPSGVWSYTLERIQKIGGSVESRVFELYWLSTSKGIKLASKGELMILNQQAKITHVVEMLDNDIRKNGAGYFRWVRIVWLPDEEDWSQLPHQRDVLGFEPPGFGGGTTYSFRSSNFGKFHAAWNSIEAFQQNVFKKLIGHQDSETEDFDEDDLSSEKRIDYTRLRDLLKAGQWKDADQETAHRMLEAVKRSKNDWIRLEELRDFPCIDLLTIDRLWVKYSQGKWGFSVQKRIYIECGAKLDGQYPGDKILQEFCKRVGWHKNGKYLNYSQLIFDLKNSLSGELPRGVGGGGGIGMWVFVFLSHPDL